MDPKHLKKLWISTLNLPVVREQFKKNLPLVKRLENETEFNELKLSGATWVGDAQLMLNYDAVAKPSIFPSSMKKLIDRGTIDNSEYRSFIPAEKGRPEEYELLKLGEPKSALIVNLRVYHPDYKLKG